MPKEKIKGNRDGKNGSNDTYTVDTRTNVQRPILVKEIEKGLHPKFHNYPRDGEKYARSNRDKSKKNNINKE